MKITIRHQYNNATQTPLSFLPYYYINDQLTIANDDSTPTLFEVPATVTTQCLTISSEPFRQCVGLNIPFQECQKCDETFSFYQLSAIVIAIIIMPSGHLKITGNITMNNSTSFYFETTLSPAFHIHRDLNHHQMISLTQKKLIISPLAQGNVTHSPQNRRAGSYALPRAQAGEITHLRSTHHPDEASLHHTKTTVSQWLQDSTITTTPLMKCIATLVSWCETLSIDHDTIARANQQQVPQDTRKWAVLAIFAKLLQVHVNVEHYSPIIRSSKQEINIAIFMRSLNLYTEKGYPQSLTITEALRSQLMGQLHLLEDYALEDLKTDLKSIISELRNITYFIAINYQRIARAADPLRPRSTTECRPTGTDNTYVLPILAPSSTASGHRRQHSVGGAAGSASTDLPLYDPPSTHDPDDMRS